MKIYTRTGDNGETGLIGGKRVPKAHPRVDAYGEVDELNCAIGAARAALGKEHAGLDEALARCQAECFVLGALLAGAKDPFPASAAARLESEIDAWDGELEPLKNFILPGGGAAGAALHLARAVCRRAERRAAALSGADAAPAGTIVYLNRLSDWLFTAARWANKKSGRPETPWAGLPKK